MPNGTPTLPSIRLVLTQLLNEHWEIPADDINLATNLRELLDSLEVIECVLAVEEHYDIHIEDKAVETIITFGDMTNLVHKLCGKHVSSATPSKPSAVLSLIPGGKS